MNERIKEAMNVVDALNELYYKQTKDDENIPFSFVYTAYWQGIKYWNQFLWDSENSCLKYNEKTDTEEPLINFVKREYKEHIKTLRKFKL